MPSPALRLAFPKGCRVRLTAMGRLLARNRKEERMGEVEGYSLDGEALYVRWDGGGRGAPWHRDYVERV